MRTVLLPVLPSAAWLGMLQALTSPPVDTTARLVGIASVLGTLTVLVYRLGVWRQEMENTKHNVGAEVKAYREESSANFDRLERRIEAFDHLIAATSSQRARWARWQARTERRLDQLEHCTSERSE
jgi:hypothetical protein